ncbi:UPF0725 protein At2g20625 [Raphanus sativus]|uniref:UPF0725 protein At2g20625 n=1 Tax=Raphanus sativus TaxID=3726 RepID=A0A6J0NAG5_RAPSA|nr:UPF0725 protein At2g20625 [Raphanus sativus]
MSGTQGWSPLQEEAILDSIVSENSDDEYDSDNTNLPEAVVEAMAARNEILAKKNQLMRRMMEREQAYSIERVVEILDGLPGVRKWSPFYCAALDHLIAGAANRQGLIAFPSAEDKIRYLEHRIKRKLDV